MSRTEIGSWRTKRWRYSLTMGEQESRTFGRQLCVQSDPESSPDQHIPEGQWMMVFAMPFLHRMITESKYS